MAMETAPGQFITARDLEMLAALSYAPFTARQLEKLSKTWQFSFPSARLVRDRLQRLSDAKLVSSHCYAISYRGQPENYYLLTRQGYQLVYGPDADPPTKGYFSPMALGRQPHQRALSDFIVQTAWAAHHSGVRFTGFYRENTIRLSAEGHSLYPDASFVLVRKDGTHLRFFAEIDNGTERVRSQKEADSIERKIRTYDAFQDSRPSDRFRVLFISAQNCRERLHHMLETAAGVMRNPGRTLFYGVTLVDYLASGLGVTAPLFLDHRGDRQSLVPEMKIESLVAPDLLRTSVQC
jgi:hypothetical protein